MAPPSRRFARRPPCCSTSPDLVARTNDLATQWRRSLRPGDEGVDDIGDVTVEALASEFVDRGCAGTCPRPARLPIALTHRCAVRRSSRCPPAGRPHRVWCRGRWHRRAELTEAGETCRSRAPIRVVVRGSRQVGPTREHRRIRALPGRTAAASVWSRRPTVGHRTVLLRPDRRRTVRSVRANG